MHWSQHRALTTIAQHGHTRLDTELTHALACDQAASAPNAGETHPAPSTHAPQTPAGPKTATEQPKTASAKPSSNATATDAFAAVPLRTS